MQCGALYTILIYAMYACFVFLFNKYRTSMHFLINCSMMMLRSTLVFCLYIYIYNAWFKMFMTLFAYIHYCGLIKKYAIVCLFITLANVNLFSECFHCLTQK